MKRLLDIVVSFFDLRTVKPIDKQIVLKSVEKTGKLVIADAGWKTCGFSAEISALLTEEGFGFLKASVQRISLPDQPAPASAPLEKSYYPTKADIIEAVKSIC